MEDEEKTFEAHLLHYGCPWCRRSFGEEHRALIESEQQEKLQNQNMRGTIRSYQMYQEALQAQIRELTRKLEKITMAVTETDDHAHFPK
jgi:hypothetical protein